MLAQRAMLVQLVILARQVTRACRVWLVTVGPVVRRAHPALRGRLGRQALVE